MTTSQQATTSDAAPAADASEAGSSTRERLLAAVTEIVGKHGHHAVSHRAVATQAGVSHGLVRHHFGSRDAMLNEAMRVAADEDLATFPLKTSSPDDFVAGLFENADEDWTRQLLQFDMVLRAIRGQGDQGETVELFERYLAVVDESLEEFGIEDPDAGWASVIWAAIDGLTLQRALLGPTPRVEAAFTNLRRLLTLLREHQGAAADPSST